MNRRLLDSIGGTLTRRAVPRRRAARGVANRVLAATGSGVLVPKDAVTNEGVDDSIFRALGDGFFGSVPFTLLGGTQDGAAHITLQPPDTETAPQITGTARVGKTLTATPGTRNGTQNIALSYRATIVVRDAAGNVSAKKRAFYRVIKR